MKIIWSYNRYLLLHAPLLWSFDVVDVVIYSIPATIITPLMLRGIAVSDDFKVHDQFIPIMYLLLIFEFILFCGWLYRISFFVVERESGKHVSSIVEAIVSLTCVALIFLPTIVTIYFNLTSYKGSKNDIPWTLFIHLLTATICWFAVPIMRYGTLKLVGQAIMSLFLIIIVYGFGLIIFSGVKPMSENPIFYITLTQLMAMIIFFVGLTSFKITRFIRISVLSYCISPIILIGAVLVIQSIWGAGQYNANFTAWQAIYTIILVKLGYFLLYPIIKNIYVKLLLIPRG